MQNIIRRLPRSVTAPDSSPHRKSVRILLATFLIYGLTVATNEGEFWPFSIYPMFSQAGNAWSRSIVRVADSSAVTWDTVSVGDLHGTPYPLLDHGVDPIDLANFVAKTRRWDDARVEGLRRMFRVDESEVPPLVVYRVSGRIADGDSIAVTFVPYVAMERATTRLHPSLPR